MASLLYGAGLRLMECVRLRVKDVDLDYRQIMVRDGKGQRDRATILPEALREPVQVQIEKGRQSGASIFWSFISEGSLMDAPIPRLRISVLGSVIR